MPRVPGPVRRSPDGVVAHSAPSEAALASSTTGGRATALEHARSSTAICAAARAPRSEKP